MNGTSLEAFDLNPAVALFTIFLENLSNHRHRPRISSSSHNLHICHFSFFGCLMNFGRKSLQFQTFLNCQPPKKLKDQCLTYVQLDFHCILGNIWIIVNHRHIKKSYIIHHFGTHTSETDKSCTSNGHRSDAPGPGVDDISPSIVGYIIIWCAFCSLVSDQSRPLGADRSEKCNKAGLWANQVVPIRCIKCTPKRNKISKLESVSCQKVRESANDQVKRQDACQSPQKIVPKYRLPQPKP